ncbi:MAG: DMT family transporter [Bacteroidetes bacterium]|jgi:drug/metabolite transporter (DMT)-like permease|nr:DMT family transporter [Bacteroidota bacterium]
MEAGTSRIPPFLIPALAVGLLAFATSPILIRYAGAAPGTSVAMMRTGMAALLLLPLVLRRGLPSLRSLDGRSFVLLGLSGLFLSLHFLVWINSLYYTSVASASVLVTMSPLFLALASTYILKEHVSRVTWIAIAAGTLGVIIMTWSDASGGGQGPNPLLGNALALLGAVFYVVHILLGRVLRRQLDWLDYVFPMYTVCGVFTLVIGASQGGAVLGYPAYIYGLCFLMAAGPQMLGHGSFNLAVRYISPAWIGLIHLLEPVGASILAVILFAEVPNATSMGGMMLVLLSVAFAIVHQSRKG